MTSPERLLHYVIERQLGQGGMGVVYRAVDTRLDRPVALKFLPEALSLQPEAKQRLLLEAKAAANLDHPNVGVIYGIEEAEGRLFIAMALYEGETLQQRLTRAPATPDEAIDWCLQAARGLAKAHDAGIVHRDVKPANLFLTRDGLLKILDFGLVKLEAPSGLTVPGALVGTPEYMAPEQVRGHPADPRVDVWSLGVVLYEALTGTSPFRDEGGMPATILRVMTATPPPLAEVAPGVPAALQGVVDRALARDAAERYATVREFARDLERAAAGAGRAADGPERAVAAGRVADHAAASAAFASSASGAPASSLSARPASIAEVTLSGSSGARAHPLLEPVPRVAGFVGRDDELAELEARLARGRLVAIRGMAGTGKSAVGARLLRERYPEEHICWFTFDAVEKSSLDALYWSVAAFLAAAGEPLLWRYLQGEIEAHRPLDRTARLNLFLTSLGATPYAFCFDEVHLVARDPEVGELLKALHRHLGSGAPGTGGTAIVVMGRELPTDLEHLAVNLDGLSLADAGSLLEGRGLRLPASIVSRLHERTAGNPTLLELAASALEPMGGDPEAVASFVESMAGRHDIRDYVMNHVVADLEADEKAVLDALSIFWGAVEPEVAEETLLEAGVDGVGRCIRSLVQRSIVHETDSGQVYCHDLVREFCYRTLDVRSRRSLHAHAARTYEARKNTLRAAHHAFEQGDAAKALVLLTDQAKAIIAAGGAASLLEQLVRFDPRSLDDEQQLALVLAKGDVLTVRGAYRQALTLYELALDDVLDEEGQAELSVRLATVCNELGEHERAIELAGAAIEALEVIGTNVARARVQRVLGMAHYRLGRLDEAAVAFGAGLELAEGAGDPALSAYLDQYLGLVDAREGRLDEARQRLERSRKAFRAQRDRIGEVEAMGNLAWVHGLAGQPEREAALLAKVLEILEQVGDVGYLLILYNNLGHIEHRAGRHHEAMGHHERLAELARRVDHRPWLAAGLVGLAEDLLALGRVDEARERAQAAYDLLRGEGDDAGPSIELAMSQRVLGEVSLALGEHRDAAAWFEASIPTFEDAQETDELARARLGLERARGATQPQGTGAGI